MNESLAVLRQCADRIEAETIRIRLASEDIAAFITGTDAATALSMGGAGTDRLVRVEVAQTDLQRAHELLQADEQRAAEAGPWICSRCHEQNEASFDICWSCSKPRTDDDQRGEIRGDDHHREAPTPVGFGTDLTVQPLQPVTEDLNPYRPVLVDDAPPKTDNVRVQVQHHARYRSENREDVRRALLASVFGILLCPPLLNAYSMYLLTSIAVRGAYSDPTLRTRIVASWAFNALAVLVLVFVYLRP